jgi:Kdo2-lipid IVA lauroyltransferase/acyltransferase
MQWIGFFFLQIGIQLFRLMPFGAVYALSDALAFLLYRVLGYRKQVVQSNLKNAFPDLSDTQLQALVPRIYRNLTDVTLETLKSYTLSLRQVQARSQGLNPEAINQLFAEGKSVILAGAHFNNWEYCGLTIPPQLTHPVWIVYKPLSNKVMDAYVNRQRARTGARLVSMDEVFGAMRRHRDEGPAMWIFLSDQSPSSRKSAHWVSFLHQDTACVPGNDVLGRKFGYPVMYFHIERLRRGFYQFSYHTICADPTQARETEITRAYSAFVEQKIRENPESWLWTHKRWKIKR